MKGRVCPREHVVIPIHASPPVPPPSVAAAAAQVEGVLAQLETGLTLAVLTSILLGGSFALVNALGGFRGVLPRQDRAVQAQHSGLVPRLGGLGIVLAFLLGMAWLIADGGSYHRAMLVIGASPVLILAAREDLGLGARPLYRLLASFAAAGLYLSLTDTLLPRSGIALLDPLLRIEVVALLVSMLVMTATTQAMNLIDGLNGLCAGVALLIFGAIAWMAQKLGDQDLYWTAALLGAVTLGFLLVNYPHGAVFLGDTGAYWLGFAAAALALHALAGNPSLAPAALLLIFFWPAFDLVLTVLRRLTRGRRLFAPDKLHPHQLAVRLLRLRLGPIPAANPLASALILSLAAPPVLLGVMLWDRNGAAWLALAALATAYGALYLALLRAGRRGRGPWRRPRGKPLSAPQRAGARHATRAPASPWRGAPPASRHVNDL